MSNRISWLLSVSESKTNYWATYVVDCTLLTFFLAWDAVQTGVCANHVRPFFGRCVHVDADRVRVSPVGVPPRLCGYARGTRAASRRPHGVYRDALVRNADPLS